MEVLVELTPGRIEEQWIAPAPASVSGATIEFRGVVRGEEAGNAITALRYEAYESMAVRQMERILNEEAEAHRCRRMRVIHRHGWIPVGEAAVLIWVESAHRAEAIALLAKFMDRLKKDVPIWKVESAPS